ncbi:sensor domain-containing diguanylate cyclase [Vreelandella neptunia]|uniref:Diguanylate cyclase n=1 Tax=Vreelandella neptunia TaxID=115551 RepID=A0ABZ0YRD8_9GAMM|nr:sensor domain-containing diguanylate cyclase [Halomonas neptunia]MDN3558844.1 diguanylate cyclase [Halomonas neptunia]WQH13811.1 diguanylate cyclase [Halomonas neptunia]
MSVHAWLFSRFSLRSRFIALIATLVFATTLLLGWVASRESAQQMEANIGNAASEAAYQMVDKLDRNMDARIKEVKLLLGMQALTTDTNPSALREQLERLQDNYNVVSWIGFTDPEGTVQAATGGILEGVSIAQRPVFIEGRESLWIGDVHEAVLLAQLLPNPSGEELQFVDIATPVYDRNEELQGVLAVHLSWEWAEYIQQSIFSPAKKRQNNEILLLSAGGTVLLGPKALMGKSLDSLRHIPGPTNISPQWAIETWPNGEQFVTGYARSSGFEDFPGLGWIAITRNPIASAFAPVEQLQTAIMGIGTLLALLFAMIGWMIASRMVTPLTRLASAADQIQDGEQADCIPLENGSPEMKRLSTSMRNMVSRLLDQRQTINRLEDLANTDPLTGLPNRAFLNQYLQLAIPEAERNQQSMVVMYIDLDGFKRVNDELGHHAGDLLLIEITQRLKNALRSGDVVARLGGDEFVMVLKTKQEYLEMLTHEVSRRLLTAIAQPILLPENKRAHVGCSLGAAWWPHHGLHIETVLQLADSALYAAKSKGKHQLVIHKP